VIAVTTAGVGLVVLVAGLRRRRFAVAAGVVLFMLAPAAALAQTTTQVVEYYSTDALGSVRAVTMQVNGEWRVVSRHDFMPFGEEVAPPPPPSDKWLFSGKERDTETGLDYFGARYMRASAGRFASVDPLQTVDENLADPQRWNRYVYGLSNPIRYADLSGLTPQDRVAAAWAFLAAKVVYKGGGGWDATNPNDGLDCAGLVRHVFMKDPDSHVSLNRSVGDEWSQLNAAAKAGTAEVSTNIKDARVGDAIFWSENGKMAHTAIIVEINKATGIVKVVHAAGKKKGLTWQRCSDADGNFWGQIFVGIGRPKESAQ
jgi:RHS repeat-associated protein